MLRNRSLAALLAAEIVSTTGSQMTWLALPWFVLLTSGSATRMSLVVAAALIGVAAGAIPGGKLVARIGARRTMMLCDGVRGPVILALPLLHWAGALTFPHDRRRGVRVGRLQRAVLQRAEDHRPRAPRRGGAHRRAARTRSSRPRRA